MPRKRAFDFDRNYLCQNCQLPQKEHGGAKHTGKCPIVNSNAREPYRRRWRIATLEQFQQTRQHGFYQGDK